MSEKKENKKVVLSIEDLKNVTGGLDDNDTEFYVEAVCEHCGTKGMHLMNSGRTAICSKCGKTILLIAQ